MNMENNRHLFLVGIGLAASGHDGYDSVLSALIDRIRAVGISDGIGAWFSRARTGKVAINPYWPRGSALAVACFYLERDCDLNLQAFTAFLEETGMIDPIGLEDFLEWISELPDMLRTLDAHPAMPALWDAYCRILEAHTDLWRGMTEKAIRGAHAFFGANAPELCFQPYLFYAKASDFVQIGMRVITLSAAHDPETMLHETMHTALSTQRETLIDFANECGLAGFADRDRMHAFGYLVDDSAESAAHVMEECFVRALSTWYAGGGDDRLRMHAAFGCTSVPMIASHVARLGTTAATLHTLVDCVLENMKWDR